MYQFLDKTEIFEFLGPNLPKNGFWGQNFKNLILDKHLQYIILFSVKMDNI